MTPAKAKKTAAKRQCVKHYVSIAENYFERKQITSRKHLKRYYEAQMYVFLFMAAEENQS